MMQSSIPVGNGIEGVSPLRKRFTIVIGLIEPEIHDCGIKMMFVQSDEREEGKGREGGRGEQRRGEEERSRGEQKKQQQLFWHQDECRCPIGWNC